MSTATLHSEKKKALVPQLRFTGFEGEWKIDRLINLTEMIRCGIAATPDYVDVGVPFLSAQNVTKEGVISLHKFSLISDEYYKVLSKNHKLLKGDILYSRVGAGYGTAAIFPYNGDFGVYVSLTHIRTNHKLTNPFLKFYLNSDLGKKQASDGVFQGGGVPNLNVKVVEKFKIPFPVIPEQQKIASFLSAVDEKIQQLTRKATLLEHYKKGVMQQLFSGKLRFKDENGKDYPDWKKVLFTECCDLIHGFQFREEHFQDIGLPVIKIGSLVDNGSVSFHNATYVSKDCENTHSRFILKKGDVLMALTGGTLGKVSRIDKDYGVIFQNYRVGKFENKSNSLKEYIYFLLQSRLVQNRVKSLVNEAAQPNFGKQDFDKIRFGLPTLQEQQKIANFLSGIDSKIENVNQQLAQTQTFKKGLLQQMFC